MAKRLNSAGLRTAPSSLDDLVATAVDAPAPKPAAPAEPEQRISLMVPESLYEELYTRAIKSKTSMRSVILGALRAQGFTVDESALVDRRRS